MTSPNIWAPGVAISANNSLKSQSFVAVEGQSVFTFTAFLYEVGTGSLQVFVGGLHQRAGVDFNETAPNSFTLTTAVSAGTIVTAVAAVEVSGTVDLAGAMAALEAHKINTATHGVGTVVGETEVQTLSNKTLVDPTVTDGTFVGATLSAPAVTEGTFDTPDISGGSADSISITSGVFSGTITSLSSPLAVSDGGTGANNAAQARTNLDVPSRAGSGASGNWSINATSADKLSTASGSAPSYPARAAVNFDGQSNTDLTGTYSQSGTTVTVTATAHGHIVGHAVYADITSGTGVDGAYTVTEVVSVDQFRYTAGSSLTTSGNVTLKRASVRASQNVANVVDAGTGDYRVNFSVAMPNANYAAIGTCSDQSCRTNNTVAPTVYSVRVSTHDNTGGAKDSQYVSVIIIG